ncbi:hypothetical protein IFM89_011478 [Coptis chinensis]|uniref:GDSL esterase/lipase n=1 Tax=Coptis chinensis TaxID=261450 RepID=A0A835ISU4_9MAGN|nr:hypothetical protein IFM89_011478 [Coptis chinensis]
MVKCQSPLAPALYIFGDSLSDTGNNNFLRTEAKANYRPYGIDFPSGVTGRFANGKTFTDFIAQLLGLPLPPAYLGLSANEKINITTGLNYASGAAGILPESGTALGDNLSFDEQIRYFQDTLLTNVFKNFIFPSERSKYLATSIFAISIGNNDYLNNYLQPSRYSSSRIFTPQQFANLLVNRLRSRLKRLYILGTRKFVVFNIGRLGCVPGVVNSANPKPTTPCVEDVNNLVLLFNSRLPSMLTALQTFLPGSTFAQGDSFGLNQNSSEAGFSTIPIPCCQVRGDGMCVPDSTPCPDRTKAIFYDAFHPTEVVNNVIANNYFSGSTCVPNIQQLAQKS